MPDVTSLLLAMYQQVIGGSTAREQSSLEAECARRVILSGMVIGPLGNIQISGGLTVGGNLAVTGSVSLSGLLTVGSLTVTGAATVNGLLTCNAGLTTTFASIVGNASVGGTLTVIGAATIGAGLNVTGGVGITGTLTVSGMGVNAFAGGGAGPVQLAIQNVAAGATNFAVLYVGNDINIALTQLLSCSSTYASAGFAQANGTVLYATGTGGLSVVANHGVGLIRFGAGGAERMRLMATGELCINATTAVGGGQVVIQADSATGHTGIAVVALNPANNTTVQVFYNSAFGVMGTIQQTGATTVAYNSASDARLKRDRGRATDLSALRALVVHDFDWITDGVRDRGVFAQEAIDRFPRAVSRGTDETTADGFLAHPWMTDYSKFVPDLIVGWQQHEAELTALRALLDVKRMH